MTRMRDSTSGAAGQTSNAAPISRIITTDDLLEVQLATINRSLATRRKTRQRLVFSHSTALLILGAELPARLLQAAQTELHVASTTHRQAASILTMHQWNHEYNEQTPYADITCCGPVQAWAQIASTATLEELVLIGDSLMRRNRRFKLAALRDFESFIDGSGKFPGKRNCELAVRLMRENTDSSRETQLRLLIVSYGLPCPEVNLRLQTHSGKALYLDMSYSVPRIAIEYQGKQHDTDPQQIRADRNKRNFLTGNDWIAFEPDRQVFFDLREEEGFMQDLARILSLRLNEEIKPYPKMSLLQALDGRREHNRRNTKLLLY